MKILDANIWDMAVRHLDGKINHHKNEGRRLRKIKKFLTWDFLQNKRIALTEYLNITEEERTKIMRETIHLIKKEINNGEN